MDTPQKTLDLLHVTWRNYAPCRGAPLSYFFAEDTGDITEVQNAARLRACNNCPFAGYCFAEIFSPGATDGVWGGWYVTRGMMLRNLEETRKYSSNRWRIPAVQQPELDMLPPENLVATVGDIVFALRGWTHSGYVLREAVIEANDKYLEPLITAGILKESLQ